MSYVAWNRVTGSATYSVERWKEDAPDCCRNTVTGLTGNDWRDEAGLPMSGTYVYRVTANYADGSFGSATVNYVPPSPINPAIIAQMEGPGNVHVEWSSRASFYTLWGPGLPNTGIRIEGGPPPCFGPSCPPPPQGWAMIGNALQYEVHRHFTNVPGGPQTWTVAAFWEPGRASTAASAFSKKTLDVIPVPPPPPPPSTPAPPPPPPPVLSDRFRLSVLGFRATSAVADDPSDRDGRGNEVYVAVQVCEAITANTSPGCSLIRSAVHGDVYGFPKRVQAGSASVNGGIKSGDIVGVGFTAIAASSQTTFPLLLWQGQLKKGNDQRVLTFAPSLWEWNGFDTEMLLWARIMDSAMHGADFYTGLDVGNLVSAAEQVPQLALVNTRPGTICASAKQTNVDRPIGIVQVPGTANPGLLCNIVGLTGDKADALLRAPAQGTLPPGIMRVDLVDVSGETYAMYLKLERLP
jgi:hypothetical protein